MIKMFGGERSRLGALYFNVIHDTEMYGEIVVYYRAKGMVPPSTSDRPAMGKKNRYQFIPTQWWPAACS